MTRAGFERNWKELEITNWTPTTLREAGAGKASATLEMERNSIAIGKTLQMFAAYDSGLINAAPGQFDRADGPAVKSSNLLGPDTCAVIDVTASAGCQAGPSSLVGGPVGFRARPSTELSDCFLRCGEGKKRPCTKTARPQTSIMVVCLCSAL